MKHARPIAVALFAGTLASALASPVADSAAAQPAVESPMPYDAKTLAALRAAYPNIDDLIARYNAKDYLPKNAPSPYPFDITVPGSFVVSYAIHQTNRMITDVTIFGDTLFARCSGGASSDPNAPTAGYTIYSPILRIDGAALPLPTRP
jgi:hypothetical protein